MAISALTCALFRSAKANIAASTAVTVSMLSALMVARMTFLVRLCCRTSSPTSSSFGRAPGLPQRDFDLGRGLATGSQRDEGPGPVGASASAGPDALAEE